MGSWLLSVSKVPWRTQEPHSQFTLSHSPELSAGLSPVHGSPLGACVVLADTSKEVGDGGVPVREYLLAKSRSPCSPRRG